jgi:hypothetical protein
MTVRVTEIIGRSAQGITRPFLCRADDGRLYYVKGNGAGRRALIAEWIAGHLGQRIGLPIPEFRQTVIAPSLIQYSARDDMHDLGAGTGFGSALVENVDELPYLFIGQIDPQLRAKILLFDWWVCNGDRTLTENGGNPNLLWSHRDCRLHVIDQNLALDDSDIGGFWDEHIFRESVRDWTQPFREEMTGAMRSATMDLRKWWNDIPEQWTETESGLTFEAVLNLLSRFDTNPRTFWRTT